MEDPESERESLEVWIRKNCQIFDKLSPEIVLLPYNASKLSVNQCNNSSANQSIDLPELPLSEVNSGSSGTLSIELPDFPVSRETGTGKLYICIYVHMPLIIQN